jgi:hypothetical protein
MSKKIVFNNKEYNLGTQSTSRSAIPDQNNNPIIEKMKASKYNYNRLRLLKE